MQYLRQSTSVSVVIGPVWATADGALKADLAYNAAGINCDIYKNGTKADITLANSAGDGYFRAASGEALYLLTLSTGHTDTIGRAEISLSATGYYCKPREFVVLDEAVYDVLFGTTAPSTLAAGALMGLANNAITAAKFDESTAFPLKSADTGATAVARTGADSDTLETLSDQMDGFATDADVAAAVRDISNATPAAGSLGAAVNSAASAGDPCATAVPGSYAAGTLGYIVGNNLNAKVGDVKTKTDSLPTDPADQSAVEAAITAAHSTTNGKIDAVDNFVDTEVAAIKAVTDKLDTAVELDGAVYRLTTNALEQAPTGGSAPTAAAIRQEIDANSTQLAAIVADTNELQTDWHDGGRLDLILDAAGSAGDPWATALPGSYGAGTAGKIVGDNINAPIGTVDTVVDAIKAVTDNLPDSGALTSLPTASEIRTEMEESGSALATALYNTTFIASPAQIKTKMEEAGSHLALIKAVTDAQGGTGTGLTAVPWNAAWDAEVQSEATDALNAYDPPTKTEMDAAIDAVPTATENADALLNRDMSAVSDTTARSPLNALRALRNKSSINEAGDTYTVTKEDDEATAWEAAVTSSENANPISGIDPT